MKNTLLLAAVGIICSLACVSAQSSSAEDGPVGNWIVNWSCFPHGDSGRYTLSITRDGSNQLGGTVDDQGHTTALKKVVVDGSKLSLSYVAPGDGALEYQLEATVVGKGMEGTWKLADATTLEVRDSGAFDGTRN